jgi:hypothetical protein
MSNEDCLRIAAATATYIEANRMVNELETKLAEAQKTAMVAGYSLQNALFNDQTNP